MQWVIFHVTLCKNFRARLLGKECDHLLVMFMFAHTHPHHDVPHTSKSPPPTHNTSPRFNLRPLTSYYTLSCLSLSLGLLWLTLLPLWLLLVPLLLALALTTVCVCGKGPRRKTTYKTLNSTLACIMCCFGGHVYHTG